MIRTAVGCHINQTELSLSKETQKLRPLQRLAENDVFINGAPKDLKVNLGLINVNCGTLLLK